MNSLRDSQSKAAAKAQDEGKFKNEIVPVEIVSRRGNYCF
jgi:acetyl-CoA acetyltransferase